MVRFDILGSRARMPIVRHMLSITLLLVASTFYAAGQETTIESSASWLSCEDSLNDFTTSRGAIRNCEWLNRIPGRIEKECTVGAVVRISDADFICPLTCGKCSESNERNETANTTDAIETSPSYTNVENTTIPSENDDSSTKPHRHWTDFVEVASIESIIASDPMFDHPLLTLERDPFRFTEVPSAVPSAEPSISPTSLPSYSPSSAPTRITYSPSSAPTRSYPVNDEPARISSSYFDYRPGTKARRGLNRWDDVDDPPEAKYWKQFDEYIPVSLGRNRCGSESRRQSPIDLRFGDSKGQCKFSSCFLLCFDSYFDTRCFIFHSHNFIFLFLFHIKALSTMRLDQRLGYIR